MLGCRKGCDIESDYLLSIPCSLFSDFAGSWRCLCTLGISYWQYIDKDGRLLAISAALLRMFDVREAVQPNPALFLTYSDLSYYIHRNRLRLLYCTVLYHPHPHPSSSLTPFILHLLASAYIPLRRYCTNPLVAVRLRLPLRLVLRYKATDNIGTLSLAQLSAFLLCSTNHFS